LQLAYTKKPEERTFRGVIALEECILEDGPDDKENGAEDPNAKSSKSKKANGTAEKEDPTASLIFRVSHKVAYKTVLKGISLHFEYSVPECVEDYMIRSGGIMQQLSCGRS